MSNGSQQFNSPDKKLYTLACSSQQSYVLSNLAHLAERVFLSLAIQLDLYTMATSHWNGVLLNSVDAQRGHENHSRGAQEVSKAVDGLVFGPCVGSPSYVVTDGSV